MDIKRVQFLVPILVTFVKDGKEEIVEGQIDYANQQVYFERNNPELKAKTLDYLRVATTLPDDRFVAPAEVAAQAARAQTDCQKTEEEAFDRSAQA